MSAREVELAELLARAQDGDLEACDRVLRDCRQDVARIAFRYLGPSPDLEDVVQEALLQVYRSLPAFKGESRFSTWLYRLVANVAKMHLRAKGSRPQLAAIEAQEAPRHDEGRIASDEATARRRRASALYRLLDNLSDKKREVLVLHDFEGMAPKRIADLLDTPIMTVRTRLFYARKELYALMTESPELRELLSELRPAADEGEPSP